MFISIFGSLLNPKQRAFHPTQMLPRQHQAFAGSGNEAAYPFHPSIIRLAPANSGVPPLSLPLRLRAAQCHPPSPTPSNKNFFQDYKVKCGKGATDRLSLPSLISPLKQAN